MDLVASQEGIHLGRLQVARVIVPIAVVPQQLLARLMDLVFTEYIRFLPAKSLDSAGGGLFGALFYVRPAGITTLRRELELFLRNSPR